MFEVKIPLKSDFPIFWDKKAPPEVHAHPSIDKQTSAIFASFAPSMFPGDEPHMAFRNLCISGASVCGPFMAQPDGE